MNYKEFSEEIHINAVNHGWWEGERSFGETIILCISEVAEALEEYRNGRPNIYAIDYAGDEAGCPRFIVKPEEFENHKPEGIAVELADVVIRCFDWFGRMNFDTDELLDDAKGGERWMDDMPIYAVNSFGDLMAHVALDLSLAYRCWCNAAGYRTAALRMAVCCNEIFDWAKDNGIDMDNVLAIKHKYNKTRSYKHGGKVI